MTDNLNRRMSFSWSSSPTLSVKPGRTVSTKSSGNAHTKANGIASTASMLTPTTITMTDAADDTMMTVPRRSPTSTAVALGITIEHHFKMNGMTDAFKFTVYDTFIQPANR